MKDCTRSRRRCDACRRHICRQCSRCFEKYPTTSAPTFGYRCPSRLCRLLKRLRCRPPRVGDTPRTGVCTEGDR